MSDVKMTFGAVTAFTITLASLSNGAGQQSTQIDLESGGLIPPEVALAFDFTPAGTPTQGERVLFHACWTNTTTDLPGGLGTSDAGLSDIDVLSGLDYLGALLVNNAANQRQQRSFVVPVKARYLIVTVWNASGVAAHATAGNHAVEYQTITPNIA